MGQQLIESFLRKNPNKWFSSRDLSQHLDRCMCSINVATKMLRRSNMVMTKKEYYPPNSKRIWMHKHRPKNW